jgi:hypothetical protein
MTAMVAAWHAVARRSHPAARAEAEAQVFGQMVVALDRRCGAGDAAHGPLAELRLLARGVSQHNGWFMGGAGWTARGSITGYEPGDRIRLTEALFTRLLTACLADLAVPA